VWTLEIEVCFYILCALLAPLFRSGSLLVLIPPTLLLYFSAPEFTAYVIPAYPPALDFLFIGVVIAFHRSGKISGLTALAAGAFVTATSLIFTYRTQGDATTVSYASALALFLTAYRFRAYFPNLSALQGLAAISYPLYVCHGIMGYVFMRILLDFGISPGIVVALGFVFAIGGGYRAPLRD
jgi:peptidoglycan/LPS O-acetylase OafA/YrhL